MDQLRVILQHVKKHHFWLVCAACLGIGVFAWMKASGNLSGEYGTRKSAISGSFQSLDQIINEPVFPNDRWKEGADELIEEQKQKVRAAWQQVYDEQAEFLKWPDYLGAGFLNTVQSVDRGADLPRSYRARYMNEINREFPKLLEIVGAQRHDVEPSGPKSMVQENVIWADTSQKAIEDKLRWETAPGALEVWLTQEDLWIYQVLLTVIKQVNAGSIVPPVKEIEELLIAQEAAARIEEGMAPGRIEQPKTEQAGAAAPAPAAMRQPAMPPGQAGQAPPLDDGRYLDAEGKPQVSGAGGDEPFRRMPFFMKLRIDQRHIPRLLAECANSPLPFDVQQFRLETQGSRPSSKSSSGSSSQSGAGSTTISSAVAPYDVEIELAGVINIYNPPDKTKLGADEAAAAETPIVPGG